MLVDAWRMVARLLLLQGNHPVLLPSDISSAVQDLSLAFTSQTVLDILDIFEILDKLEILDILGKFDILDLLDILNILDILDRLPI